MSLYTGDFIFELLAYKSYIKEVYDLKEQTILLSKFIGQPEMQLRQKYC